MAQKKAFPLRLDPATYDALQRWADDDLRSLNGQIEFLLRRALRQAKRLPDPEAAIETDDTDTALEPEAEGK
jgi:hypothetical protein